MSPRDVALYPLDEIASALGDIPCPGSLDGFANSLARPYRNVMRCRRGIDPEALNLSTVEVPWYPLGRRPVEETKAPSRTIAYACGDFFVQDAGSLLALAAAGAGGDHVRGKLVCDLCAAPGGKASALVEALTDGPAGFVLANEVIRSRMGPLQLNLSRTGSDRFAIVNEDPATLSTRLPGVFDLVVVDAPCSGQAMMGRGKQKTSALSEHQIQHSASRQRRILDAAVQLLRDGGQLIYSTCTFAEAENEGQMRRLIDQGIATPKPVDFLSQYETSPGCYRCWPHLHDCAGSFAASMTIHHDQTPALPQRRRKKRHQSRSGKTSVDVTTWYNQLGDAPRLCQQDSVVFGFPVDAPSWVEDVAIGGPELAHRAGQTWKPAHAGALRRESQVLPSQVIEIDEDACRQFMRGEPIKCDARGWHAIRLHGRPLGWIKADGRLGKNHLPTAARMTGVLSS
ncbi:MAG: methyltransferase RsmF C-terminal domain-like protein [Rubripirellula sp.]